MQPGESFEKSPPPPSIGLRQLTGRVTGLRRSLARIVLLSLALQVFVVLAPFYMQWVVDQALVSADRDLLVVLGLGFGLSIVLQAAIARRDRESEVFRQLNQGKTTIEILNLPRWDPHGGKAGE